MDEKNKTTRLSDVAKRNTTDRASKLAGAFIPAPPAAAAPPVELSQPVADPAPEVSSLSSTIEQGEKDFAEGKGTTYTVDELKALSDPTPPAKSAPADKPKERTRRSGSTMDLAEVVSQPTPKGLRCTKMIMLVEEHHDLLRELAFKFKMPMTEVLYNLLEPARQALQREQNKGD
jgi:hypothetical protein